MLSKFPLLTAGLISVTLLGCAGTLKDQGTTALAYVAEGVVAVDGPLSQAYENKSAESLKKAKSLEEYQKLMEPYEAAADSFFMLRNAIRVAYAFVQVDNDKGFMTQLGCVTDALDTFLKALDEIDVMPTKGLQKAVGVLRPFVGTCPSGLP